MRLKYRVYHTPFDPATQLPVYAIEWSLLGCRMSECSHPEFDAGPACPNGMPGLPKTQGRPHAHLIPGLIRLAPSHTTPQVPTASKDVAPAAAIHSLESTIVVRELFSSKADCSFEYDANCLPIAEMPNGVALVYANFHCHAPACIDAELWNDATGELICRVTAVYGKGDTAGDETGFHKVPPCVWGSADDGLSPLPVLSLDTRLRATLRTNTTYGQYGMMANWMLRAASATAVELAAMNEPGGLFSTMLAS